MRGHEAYQQNQIDSQPRVDIVIALYRKALEFLQRARLAFGDGRAQEARGYLVKVHLIVNSLASGMAGSTEEIAVNFLQLYEFVNDRLTHGAMADIDAAEQVLRTLLEAFETARGEAVGLEASGVLPAFGQEHTLQVTT